MTERRDRLADSQTPGSERVARPNAVGRAIGSHVSRRRIALAALAVSGLVVLGYGAARLLEGGRTWLHARPEYAIPFDRIELSPPPPEEVRGGAAGLLQRVKMRARLDDPLPLLSTDLDELGRAFAKYAPWIAKVERVERAYPDRLTIRVSYHRRPVARIESPLDPSKFLAVTDDGIALPGEDVTPALLASLPILSGVKGLDEARPGQFVGLDRSGETRAEMASAIDLAQFFAKSGATGPGAVQILQVDGSRAPSEWWVLTNFGWVQWSRQPDDGARAVPGPAERLERLKAWRIQNPQTINRPPHYLDLEGGKVKVGSDRDKPR